MEQQIFQEVTTGSQYAGLRAKLTDWILVPNFVDSAKNVIVRPSLNYETVSYTPGLYKMRTVVSLYFFDECNSGKIFELFTALNFKVISYSENYADNSRELGMKNNSVLPYSKYVIDYQFIKSLSCTSC